MKTGAVPVSGAARLFRPSRTGWRVPTPRPLPTLAAGSARAAMCRSPAVLARITLNGSLPIRRTHPADPQLAVDASDGLGRVREWMDAQGRCQRIGPYVSNVTAARRGLTCPLGTRASRQPWIACPAVFAESGGLMRSDGRTATTRGYVSVLGLRYSPLLILIPQVRMA